MTLSKKPKPAMVDREIPEDIKMDIMSRVPTKTVLRCRCVCKRWSSLLLQPEFVKQHLKRSFSENILIDTSPNFQILNSLNGNRMRDIEFSLVDRRFEIPEIVGNCHGLFCFFIRKLSTSCEEQKYSPRVIIYIPTTGIHNELPTPLEMDKSMLPYWGFGYDPSQDDYKVVLGVRIIKHSRRRTIIMVLNLKEYHWRTVLEEEVTSTTNTSDGAGGNLFQPVFHTDYLGEAEKVLFGLGVSRFADYFAGYLLWIHPPQRQQPTLQGTICFDLAKEEVKEFPWKNFPLPYNEYPCDAIGFVRGRLWVTYTNMEPPQLWIMNEFGDEGSWVKLCNIYCDIDYNSLKPAFFLGNGELLLDIVLETLDRELVAYSPLTGDVRSIADCGQPYLYRESLVSPHGMADK